VSARGHENIRGLDVPVHDPFRVRRVQRVRNLDSQLQQRFHFQRTPGDPVLQRHPFQKFHRNERMPVVLADFVDCANIGVIQRGRRPRLAAKAFQRRRILRHVHRKKFQRDEASQLGIFGFIDHAHPAAAQLFRNAVMRDDLPDE
jgi:hypothetical protein